jgi:signal peptide peptidase SppA
MSFSLIRDIAAQIWLIQPDYAQQVAPFVASLLAGNAQPWEQKENVAISYITPEGKAIEPSPIAGELSDPDQPAGSVAVYRLQGPLMKNDQLCGPKGTATMAAELRALDANPNIAAIVLSIDSPGGTVNGTEDMARTIAAMQKPVVTYVDGMMASAAYWIGSAAQHVMLGGNTAMAGSIGTMVSMADVKPMLEKAGVKFHEIKATRSTDKNADWEQLLQGNYEGYRTKVLDPLNQAFTSSIEAQRAGKLNLEKEDVLTGKVYIGKQAIKAGLADSMGSLQDAVAMARKLSKTKNAPKMKIAAQYPTLAAVAAIDAEAETLEVGSVELTATELQAIEQHLADNANAATLQTELAAAQADLATAQTDLATATETASLQAFRITALEAQVQALQQQTDDAEDTAKPKDDFVHQKQTPRTNSMLEYAAKHGIVSKS